MEVQKFLLTDNATNFTSQVLPQINEIMGIRGVLTTLYHPKSNETIECINGTLEAILYKLILKNLSQWSIIIQSAAFAYNIGF